jgi:hypothetical protein
MVHNRGSAVNRRSVLRVSPRAPRAIQGKTLTSELHGKRLHSQPPAALHSRTRCVGRLRRRSVCHSFGRRSHQRARVADNLVDCRMTAFTQQLQQTGQRLRRAPLQPLVQLRLPLPVRPV